MNDIKFIASVVKEETGVDVYKNTQCRQRHLVDARFLFYTLLMHNKRMGLEKAGKILNKDHATVIHSVKTYKSLMSFPKKNNPYRYSYNNCMNIIRKYYKNNPIRDLKNEASKLRLNVSINQKMALKSIEEIINTLPEEHKKKFKNELIFHKIR